MIRNETALFGLLTMLAVLLAMGGMLSYQHGKILDLQARLLAAKNQSPKVIREYYQQCQGCGEWLYSHSPPTEPIESCPLCPMTVGEFAEIQRRIREGNDGED